MRALRLTQIAVQAEGLRLRRRARRAVVQLAMAVAALPFLIAALASLEAAFWLFLVQHFDPGYCGLIIAAANILIAGLFGLIAWTQGGEDRISLEALQVRQRAVDSVTRSIALTSMIGPVLGFLVDRMRRSRRRK